MIPEAGGRGYSVICFLPGASWLSCKDKTMMIVFLKNLYRQKDKWRLFLWISGMLLFWLWDFFFLNAPALHRLETGLFNTFSIAALVSLLSLLFAWLSAWGLTVSEEGRLKTLHSLFVFLLNLLRSVPQILGVLAVYYFIVTGQGGSTLSVILLMSMGMALFIFIELIDLMRERISFYQQSDFYAAMRVNGISQHRIINFDILWKNSGVHILNKLVAIFGTAVFLQCSVDFILSVGLSTEISAVNLPVTLGSLLAKTDSKQDILAIGYSLFHLNYLPKLFFVHLQGISTAFFIVFSLFSIFKISNGFAERHRL